MRHSITWTYLMCMAFLADASAQSGKLPNVIPDLMNRAGVPGLSIALIEHGRVAWVGAFGTKNAKTADKVDDSTVFEAASLSKPVFAYAVLKLVEAGKLDLDTPLSKYLPAYVENDPRVNLITARLVLTHRTGFPNWRPGDKPLLIQFKPGERFSYSGEGFVYLQRVVEKITGQGLDAFMKHSVFDPLRMVDSSYLWQDKYETLAARGHNATGIPSRQFKPLEPLAASTLLTTTSDYAQFVIAIMNGTGLKKETWHAMLASQSRVDAGCFNCIGRPLTRTSETISWGLGWGLEETPRGGSFWHWGDNGDFKAFVAGSVSSKRGVVIFTNSANGMMIIQDIAAEAMGEAQPAFNWIHYERYDSPRN